LLKEIIDKIFCFYDWNGASAPSNPTRPTKIPPFGVFFYANSQGGGAVKRTRLPAPLVFHNFRTVWKWVAKIFTQHQALLWCYSISLGPFLLPIYLNFAHFFRNWQAIFVSHLF